MEYESYRPICVDKHPLVRRKYIVPTPSIDEFYQKVKRCIGLRMPGAIIYSLPRFGKTYAIRYSKSMLSDEYRGVPVFSFLCEKNKSHSEGAFFSNLLSECGHKAAFQGNAEVKRDRLYQLLRARAEDSGHDLLILFADEAQRLEVIEYEWLRDIHDKLEKRGIRLITFLVGQHELLTQKNSLVASGHTQIVGRFMVEQLRFNGLRSVNDFATCLQGYDEACYPEGTGWPYTRFFLRFAFDAGFRLVSQAEPAWDSFVDAHQKAGPIGDIEVPMQYFSRAVEIALFDNMKNDSEDFKMSQALWRNAVVESRFIIAQEQLNSMAALL